MSDDGVPFGLVPSDPDLRLRPTNAGDEPFTRQLFREVRGEQFIAAGLSGPILEQIIEQQFRSQTAGYAAQFPGAISFIVTRNDAAIGRLLLDCASERWHIIDVALLPAACGRGIGTRIIEALEAGAGQRGVGALTLMVLATNGAARRFYLRQGFAEVGQAGASHIAMRKTSPSPQLPRAGT
ncbi:GNAT family N-acetyltransferase [Bradyrhizobium xenonodulans]|uniref:GNAT family N-acetyltransferase n=1 Tax=Bradyrhizobium xenonodulans TaxID=2736875 RepID=A0ABY7MVL1_9BRAD|nr:GNAT family N-acetyltransferase [Bradyrhizobium xenonodulans]WBL82430.1 GNAT family N-acetyltransferase [Bradyrhizobium xenonodulans]